MLGVCVKRASLREQRSQTTDVLKSYTGLKLYQITYLRRKEIIKKGQQSTLGK